MQHEVTANPGGLPYRNGVGICLFNKNGQVFCAERRDRPGSWQMPQGGIRKGEDPALAVFREMKEEVGNDQAVIVARYPELLRYDFPDYLQYKNGVFHGKYCGQEQAWFALLYQGRDSDINLSSEYEEELPEFINWKWADLAITPSLIVDFKRPVYDKVVSAFHPLVDRIRSGDVSGQGS